MTDFIMRFPGGKFYQEPWINAHLPQTRTYIEPFAGVGTVMLSRTRSQQEILIERDPEIANLLLMLRDHPREMQARLKPVRWDEGIWKGARRRLSDHEYENAVERAVLTYIVRRMGYSGNPHSWSNAWKRQGKNPHKWWDNSIARLPTLTTRLARVRIILGNAFDLLTELDGDDALMYMDPPYPFSVRESVFYGPYELSEVDHIRLCWTIRTLKAKVVISSYPNPLYARILHDWDTDTKPFLKRFRFAKYPEERAEVTEQLWWNF